MNILTDVKYPPPTIKMLVYIRKGDEPIPEIKVYFNLYEQAQQFSQFSTGNFFIYSLLLTLTIIKIHTKLYLHTMRFKKKNYFANFIDR